MTQDKQDKIAKELGVDKFAPQDTSSSKSFFGSNAAPLEDFNAEKLKEFDGCEYLKDNPALETPTFYSKKQD